jgi:hypothetical protein
LARDGALVDGAADFKPFSLALMPELEQDDFDALLNLDAIVDKGAWSFDDGGVHGFTVDMDWLGASTSTDPSRAFDAPSTSILS